MSRLLMCPPDYYGIEYEINPWMSQWQALTQVLEKEIGTKLEFMEAVPGLPDLVFTANAGVLHEGKAVPSRFRHPERQREERHFIDWFTKKGYEVINLDAEIYFEGAGDLLEFPEFWIGGYRQRSDIQAYDRLSKIFQKKILPVELVDQRFYHLDTCFCPLSGGELLYFPPAFDTYAQTVLASRIEQDKRFAVPSSEAQRFACNAVCIDRHVVLPTECPETMEWLAQQGYTPHPVKLDEFLKAGGSAKCLTLALD
jgi:N-dimethylarginine dimethylaminohydrolase